MDTIRTDSGNPGFISLIKLLDQELLGEYGEMQTFYNQFNKVDTIKNVIVAHIDNAPVGCGALKKHTDDTAEVKRMYVKTELRGQQIAVKILQQLELWAIEEGVKYFVLETGDKQLKAIDLYKKNGYQVIENYGQYAGVESSICMKKQIFPAIPAF